MFVHLNTHSIYSPMRGLLSLPEMMDLAKSCSMGTLALTDVNGLWGFIRFVQHCRSYSCLLYTSPSPRDYAASRMPSSA